MYVGHGAVVDAISSGVTARPLSELLSQVDHALPLAPLFATGGQAQHAANAMLNYVGRPYDYAFMPSDGAMYCSEAIWSAYRQACRKEFGMTLRKRLGVDTVTPQDLVDARKFFSPIKLHKRVI
jgi:uncharacterized protein YycO